MPWTGVLRIVAYALLALSGFSGLALFLRAAFGGESSSSGPAGTLWGIFIVGGAAGVAIIATVRF